MLAASILRLIHVAQVYGAREMWHLVPQRGL